MKTFLVLLLLTSNITFAESSKLIRVDLDIPTTEIVLADLGQYDLNYWIDKTTCVCGVIAKGSGPFSVAHT